jgi:hypothetical protein
MIITFQPVARCYCVRTPDNPHVIREREYGFRLRATIWAAVDGDSVVSFACFATGWLLRVSWRRKLLYRDWIRIYRYVLNVCLWSLDDGPWGRNMLWGKEVNVSINIIVAIAGVWSNRLVLYIWIYRGWGFKMAGGGSILAYPENWIGLRLPILWTHLSSDPISNEFFLWEYLKEHVFSSPPNRMDISGKISGCSDTADASCRCLYCTLPHTLKCIKNTSNSARKKRLPLFDHH